MGCRHAPCGLVMFFDFKYNRDWADNLAIVMQFGLTIAGSIVFCFFIGRTIDKWLGTKGIFLTIFTILGVVGGGVTAYRQIDKVLEPINKARKNEKSAESENGDINGNDPS